MHSGGRTGSERTLSVSHQQSCHYYRAGSEQTVAYKHRRELGKKTWSPSGRACPLLRTLPLSMPVSGPYARASSHSVSTDTCALPVPEPTLDGQKTRTGTRADQDGTSIHENNPRPKCHWHAGFLRVVPKVTSPTTTLDKPTSEYGTPNVRGGCTGKGVNREQDNDQKSKWLLAARRLREFATRSTTMPVATSTVTVSATMPMKTHFLLSKVTLV